MAVKSSELPTRRDSFPKSRTIDVSTTSVNHGGDIVCSLKHNQIGLFAFTRGTVAVNIISSGKQFALGFKHISLHLHFYLSQF